GAVRRRLLPVLRGLLPVLRGLLPVLRGLLPVAGLPVLRRRPVRRGRTGRTGRRRAAPGVGLPVLRLPVLLAVLLATLLAVGVVGLLTALPRVLRLPWVRSARRSVHRHWFPPASHATRVGRLFTATVA